MRNMSQIQSFFIRAGGEPSDCEELNHFLRSHKVIRLNEGFVSNGSDPGFQILVEYADNNNSYENKGCAKRTDWRTMLKNEKQTAIFDGLRTFRALLCKKEKLVGAYMIAKDEHLFAMAQKPDMSAADIEALPHSANIRLKEYSNALHDELQRLYSLPAAPATDILDNGQAQHETGTIPF